MSATKMIKRLHQHRTWVNQMLIDAASSLTEQQLHESFPIGQGTVWRTLTHLLAAEYIWLEALQGNESPTMPGDVPDKLVGNQEGADAIASLTDLQTRWQTLNERWEEFLETVSDQSLESIVYKVGTSSAMNLRVGTRQYDVLFHVCTHAHYTAAQMINMLRQLGVTPLPDPMLITLARSEA